jgi:predicted Zn-dependent protease
VTVINQNAKAGGAVFSRAKHATRNVIALAMALLLPITSHAGLIRDAEIEHSLRMFSRPIFTSANIDHDSVRILIVNSPEVNAYVAGGLNIFLNTGLIRETKNSGMLIGVIAHETGHIAGAHLSQFREKASRAALGGLIGAVVGAAAMAGGAGKAGAGIIAGSQNLATRSFLTDIRLNEQSADHAALKYFAENDMSASGMLEMFELLRRRESGNPIKDKYLLTHPLSTERIATIRNHLQESSVPEGQMPKVFEEMHARMVAKLVAFTEPYATTINLYPISDTTLAGRYARSIAEFKRSHTDEALAGINILIKQHPKDPFFYDTKGQILFENGKLTEAASAYAKAHSLKPDSALITTDYARTLIAQEKPALLNQAIMLLERSRELDDSYTTTWRQLAIAYGKQGKLGLSYLALAEESALEGDYETVIQHVSRARNLDQKDGNLRLQLEDLERDAKAQIERKKKEESVF